MDRDTWTPPAAPAARGAGTVGTLYGSRLFLRPEHAAARATVETFLAVEGPVVWEIGFDHGIVLLDAARAHPDVRYLGAEIRRKRVEAVLPNAPPNCLPVRADARALVALIPDERLSHVLVQFPTPALHGHHWLFTPEVRDGWRRALAPGGSVTVQTDVPALVGWVDALFAGWGEGAAPPLGGASSRRARVCARDGLTVWTRSFLRPDAAHSR
jgi:tRNA G46 methylase TrmB